jgi:hypothetical protein
MREKYPDSKDADTIERFAREFAVVFEKDPAKTLSIYDDIAKDKSPYDYRFRNGVNVLEEPVCPLVGHLYCVNFSMGTYPSVTDESGLFSDEEKKFYDFQFFVEKTVEAGDKNQFPIIGYKHHASENITWTKDR